MKEFIDWLFNTPLSHFVTDYRWVWPISESLHVMGLVFLVGTVSIFDLRVLGLGKGIAPSVIHRLVPLGVLGFCVSITTGIMFISGAPDQYFYNSAFHWKVVFLTAMGLNVAFFYSRPFRVVKSLGPRDDAPRTAKVCAALSLLFLVGVMLCGRMLTFFRPPPI